MPCGKLQSREREWGMHRLRGGDVFRYVSCDGRIDLRCVCYKLELADPELGNIRVHLQRWVHGTGRGPVLGLRCGKLQNREWE